MHEESRTVYCFLLLLETRIHQKTNEIDRFSSFRVINGLDVRDFASSWRDGLAFNALIYAIRPELIDLRRIQQMDVHQRLDYAFNIAEQQLGIPRLIDAEGLCLKVFRLFAIDGTQAYQFNSGYL